MFWGATHRKIVEVLEIDRQVNDPNYKKKKKRPQKSSQKIGLNEALKRF